jgi:hypothetical protein
VARLYRPAAIYNRRIVQGRLASLAAVLGAAGLLTLASVRAAQQPPAASGCPVEPTPTLSPAMPADVCIPNGFTGIAVEYFDDYSWRAFVSLVWPAAAGQRGVPDTRKGIAAEGPRVFETYKAMSEIFHPDGSAPERAFNRYDTAAGNPCGVQPKFGDVVIGSASGIDDIGQSGIGALDPPVVAQNGRYIRTLTLFNQLEFDHIVGNRFFLRSALPEVPRPRPDEPVMDFPDGSIAVKTAWVDVTGLPPALVKRIYTRPALVKRPAGGGCTTLTMGLIGLHIAQKTASRPQWIWSSFEHKDAVPPAWPDNPGAFVLNDRTATPLPDKNPLTLVPLAPEPVPPFNVTRDPDAPIMTRTDLSSFAYQKLLAGTPWQYYKLIVTQWPRLEGPQTDPIPARVDGSPPNTFPGTGAFSAFANVTMETFDQKRIELGCMSCHNRARMTADFMWSVVDHAYPPQFGPALKSP